MRRYARAGLPLLAIAMLIMSCGQSAVTPERVGGDKWVEPMPLFAQTLTQEHLASVWNAAMYTLLGYEEISGVINLAAGGTVKGIGETYPSGSCYCCSLVIHPNSLSSGPKDLPEDVEFVIQVPKYRTGNSTVPQSFDVFARYTGGEKTTAGELNFYPDLTLTVCDFPWVEDPPEEGTEYFYRIFKEGENYDFHDLQEVVRNPLTQHATYQIDRLLIETNAIPDHSGTAVNETDPDDEN